MRTKTFFQGGLTLALFFSVWMMLAQIDWMQLLNVKQISKQTEEKLGEILWGIFKTTENENTDPFVEEVLDSLLTNICLANDIEKSSIKLHVLMNDQVNAFALPDGHLVIYSGLIVNADNPEELAGVICHEIAHIELRHVMKKLIKEIGLSMLISMTTGGSGGGPARETAKMLSSTAYDRTLEKEADLKAVDYLTKAGINPEPFANFFTKLSQKEPESMKYFSWMSTHPDTRARATYIREYINRKQVENNPMISDKTWERLQSNLK